MRIEGKQISEPTNCRSINPPEFEDDYVETDCCGYEPIEDYKKIGGKEFLIYLCPCCLREVNEDGKEIIFNEDEI